MKSLSKPKIMMFLFAAFLCLTAGIFLNPVKVEAAAKAKVVLEFTNGTKKTWKTGDDAMNIGKKQLAYIYFGEYPQTEIKGKKLTKAIKNAKYNSNGIATVKGVKYKRISKAEATRSFDSSVEDGDWFAGLKTYFDWSGREYTYFKLEPIKWRVLSYKDGKALLVSEYGLDDKKYNESLSKITWEECTLRTWLNDDFLKTAFNTKERKLIKISTVVNADISEYNIDGGNNTKDKIFLLSIDEVKSSKYGFNKSMEELIERCCAPTDFAKAMGANLDKKNKTSDGLNVCWWWLRSPGKYENYVSYVKNDGSIYNYGIFNTTDDYAVRPALKLNLSALIK